MVNNSIVAQILPPKIPSKEDDNIRSMPLLKLESCDCNCTSFPKVSNVLLEEGDGNAYVDQDMQDQSEKNVEDDEASTNNVCEPSLPTTLLSETFTLKGSSFHGEFQRVLRSCKHMLLENIPIEMRLCNEPVNINDENAVVVQAKVHGKFQSIGYIPGKKLQKVGSAVNNNAITDIVLTRVQYSYIWGAGEHKYIPQITITKHGKWLQDDKTYRYNALFD